MNLKEYISKHIDKNFDGNLPFDIFNKKVNKGYVFSDYGQLENKVYFLNKGIVLVEIQSKNESKILDFFFENSFFSSYSSLLTNVPSDVRITSFTACEVEIIKYQELKTSYDTSLLTNKLGRIETEKLYYKKVQREKELLTKTAEERYTSLLSSYPEIIEQIPIKEISRYLGIKPESLSRIRKNIFS